MQKVLYIYDYLLTLPSEVSVMWSARFSIPKLLFFTNRYAYLLFCTLTIYTVGYNPSDVSLPRYCDGIASRQTS